MRNHESDTQIIIGQLTQIIELLRNMKKETQPECQHLWEQNGTARRCTKCREWDVTRIGQAACDHSWQDGITGILCPKCGAFEVYKRPSIEGGPLNTETTRGIGRVNPSG